MSKKSMKILFVWMLVLAFALQTATPVFADEPEQQNIELSEAANEGDASFDVGESGQAEAFEAGSDQSGTDEDNTSDSTTDGDNTDADDASEDENGSGGDASDGDQDPAEGNDPAEGDDPAEGSDPAEGDDPAEGSDPAEGDDPAEGSDPAEGTDPTEGNDPAEGEDLSEGEGPTEGPMVVSPAKTKIASVTIKYKSLPYTGKKVKQTGTTVVTAVVNGKETVLTYGTDYKITYSDNINAGTATMKVTGKGDYKGTIKKQFKITKVKLKSAELKYSFMTYTGKARTQTNTTVVTATVNGADKTLKKGRDYTVSYKNNVNVGTAKIVIKGKGNYSGTITKTFNIYPKITAKKTRYWKRNNRKWYVKITATADKQLWTTDSGRDYGLYVDTVGGLGLSPLGVYYYYDNGTLIALDALTGEVKWKYKNSKDMAGGSHACFDSKGNAYIVSGLVGTPIAVINKKGKLVKRISWGEGDSYMWPKKLQYENGKILLSASNIFGDPVTLQITVSSGKVKIVS